MKRVLGVVLAGLVGAGTLFSGVGVAHAEEVVIEENVELQDVSEESTETQEEEGVEVQVDSEKVEESENTQEKQLKRTNLIQILKKMKMIIALKVKLTKLKMNL